jgi:3-methyl-2-oxobutanoate hydroxymethyltransferase
VLEALPRELAAEITRTVRIPTIGIGAGPDCDGQVLVLHDMLGAGLGKRPRFVRNFLQGNGSIEAAVRSYVAEVRAGRFPAAENVYPEMP